MDQIVPTEGGGVGVGGGQGKAMLNLTSSDFKIELSPDRLGQEWEGEGGGDVEVDVFNF